MSLSTSVRLLFLHEEGHIRFYKDKLDWNDIKIDKLPQNWLETRIENEFNADKYAAKIFLDHYKENDPCETMLKARLAHQECLKEENWFQRKIRRIGCHPDYHPPFEERVTKIKEFCEEWRRSHLKELADF